jgi:hypothetical protein
MELSGMAYNAAARDALLERIQDETFSLQGQLDTLAGIKNPSFAEVADIVCFKSKRELVKDWRDILLFSKPSWK